MRSLVLGLYIKNAGRSPHAYIRGVTCIGVSEISDPAASPYPDSTPSESFSEPPTCRTPSEFCLGCPQLFREPFLCARGFGGLMR